MTEEPAMPAPIEGDAAVAPDAEASFHPAYGPSRTSALLSVRVPAEAKIYVNETSTKTGGTERRYVSRGLEPGRTYTFNVRAELDEEGQTRSETKVVQLTAGSTAELDFELSQDATVDRVAEEPEGVETKLTLHVPDNAKVFLEGKSTRLSGEVRDFTTTKLAAGTVWEDYTVRVALQRNGSMVTQERTISLRAGEEQELRFEFDATQVAEKPAGEHSTGEAG